jgi:hypothetical protein
MVARGSSRLSVAALALAAAWATHASSSRPAWADEPADGAAEESASGDPGQDTQIQPAGDAYADTDPSALTDFQPTLDPHGTWIDDSTYGTVWTPNPDEVGADFAPYVSGGHWAYDDDYVWQSDYAWGWAAFHYGRWVLIRDRGWSWIPGRLYANAWVVWRVGDDAAAYVGWAPAPPTWGWRGGIAGMFSAIPAAPYFFVQSRDVFAPSIGTHVVSGEPAAAIGARTRPYVKAAPTVGVPVQTAAVTVGPPPTALGIEPSRITRVVRSEPTLLRARQFARPSTARALGGSSPVPHMVRPTLASRPYVPQRTVARPAAAKRR